MAEAFKYNYIAIIKIQLGFHYIAINSAFEH